MTMWTKEKLEAVARKWAFDNADATSPYMNKMRAFLAGCEYIINNTQKENDTEGTEERRG